MNPFDHQTPVPGIQHIIAVGSGKGGVGKSTVAANLSVALRSLGKQVGLLDTDIYGPSVPRLFGVLGTKPAVNEKGQLVPIVRYGVKLMSMGFLIEEDSAVIWRGPMLFKAMDQFFKDVDWGHLDYLIVDLPPGTGDVALTLAQKVPLHGGIVICTPQNLALMDAKKAIDMFEKIKIPLLGVVENMAFMKIPPSGLSQNEQTDKIQLFPKGELDSFLDSRKISKLAQIPFHPHVALTSEAGIPIVESQPQSDEGQIFKKIAEDLVKKMGAS
ncbi:MAG: Mrp/NBP35 family ATP-binding protein [Bdellovibrionales bacterium]|nr:Mrp/NBP35 family ATP-binding protein [Bdellovibrionales bacterium]